MGARLISIVLAGLAGLGGLAVTAGCGGNAGASSTTPAREAPPTVSDAELDATMTAGLAFITELGDRLAAVSGQDCAVIATTIEDTAARNAAIIEASARLDQDPAVKLRADAWLEPRQAELNAAAERIGAAVAPCTEDPAVQAAVEKLAPP